MVHPRTTKESMFGQNVAGASSGADQRCPSMTTCEDPIDGYSILEHTSLPTLMSGRSHSNQNVLPHTTELFADGVQNIGLAHQPTTFEIPLVDCTISIHNLPLRLENKAIRREKQRLGSNNLSGHLFAALHVEKLKAENTRVLSQHGDCATMIRMTWSENLQEH